MLAQTQRPITNPVPPAIGKAVIHRRSHRKGILWEISGQRCKVQYQHGYSANWSVISNFYSLPAPSQKPFRQWAKVRVRDGEYQFAAPPWANCRVLAGTLFVTWSGVLSPDEDCFFEVVIPSSGGIQSAIEQLTQQGIKVVR